jgi:predicted DNA-binding transcriptional regulator YafY
VRAQAEFVRQRILVDARGWRDSAETITSLPVLLEALWRGRQLRFDYPHGDAVNERIVDPLGLVARGNAWYLVANKGELRRTYRVSRILAAAVLDQPARRPAGFDLAQHWERAATEFREKLPRYYATFLVDRDAMPWVRYRGKRIEEQIDEGERVRVRMRFDVDLEALQFALALGASVEAVEPPELRARVLEVARSLMSRYASAG